MMLCLCLLFSQLLFTVDFCALAWNDTETETCFALLWLFQPLIPCYQENSIPMAFRNSLYEISNNTTDSHWNRGRCQRVPEQFQGAAPPHPLPTMRLCLLWCSRIIFVRVSLRSSCSVPEMGIGLKHYTHIIIGMRSGKQWQNICTNLPCGT